MQIQRGNFLQQEVREAVFQNPQNLVACVGCWGRSGNHGLGKSLSEALQPNTEALLRSQEVGCQPESSEHWHGLWSWELLQNCPQCGLFHPPWSETRKRKRTANSSTHTVAGPIHVPPHDHRELKTVQRRQNMVVVFKEQKLHKSSNKVSPSPTFKLLNQNCQPAFGLHDKLKGTDS